MITFTEKGAEKVQEFLASQSADVQTSGLRVGVRGGGCSGRPFMKRMTSCSEIAFWISSRMGLVVLTTTPPW